MRTIGIDIGTSAVKAVLVETGEDVTVTQSVTKPYCADGAPIREPDRWVALAHDALDQLNAHGRPDAIGFTGQMHGFIALDREGKLTAPVKLWLDMDGAPELDAFVARNGGPSAMIRRSGNIPLPDFTLAKWLHSAAADEDLPGRVHRLLCVKDYVRAALDPHAAFIVDANEACGTQLQNPFAGQWSEDLVGAAGVPRSALPEIADASVRAGDWRGVPLILGVGDQASAMRALGVEAPGTVSLSLGTSGGLSLAVSPHAIPGDWDGAFHLFPTGYSATLEVIGTVPSFGGSLRWLARLLGRTVAEIDGLAAATTPGARAPAFLPYLAGSGPPNPDHHVKAELTGLTANVGPELLVRSVYDGLAQEFRAILDEARQLGIKAERVILSGSPARLTALSKTLAAYLDADCFLVEAVDASAIGAALLAADHLDAGLKPKIRARPLSAAKVEPDPAWLAARRRVLGASHQQV
jgi:xylulokinase